MEGNKNSWPKNMEKLIKNNNKKKKKEKEIKNNYNMKTRTFKKSYKKISYKESIEIRKGLEKLKCIFFDGRRSRRATKVKERRN